MSKKKRADRKHKETDDKFRFISSLNPYTPWIGGILFCLFAGFLLMGPNYEYLRAVQERSLFTANADFFHNLIATPGGIVHWLGCFFTQFFYHPILGCSLLLLIWLSIYAVSFRAFRLSKSNGIWALVPLFALLSSILDLGYWLYYLKIQGYWFSESLAYLFTLLGVWGSHRFRSPYRMLYLAGWTILAYPLLGWYALLGSILILLVHLVSSPKEKKESFLFSFIGAALIGIVPLVWYYFYNQMRMEEAWTYGFPLFQTEETTSWITSVPFFVLILSSLLLACFNGICPKAKSSRHSLYAFLVQALLLIGCCVGTLSANFDDPNYRCELSMYRHMQERDWHAVIAEAEKQSQWPTRQIIVMRNIALMNTGEWGKRAFRFENNSLPPYTRDSLRVEMAQTIAPMVYFQYGKFNYANRWAIENGVEFGFKVNDLKILAHCAILSGEKEAASKYIKLLEETTFHQKEARKLREWLKHPEKAKSDFALICELHQHDSNLLDSDNGECEIYLTHNFATTMNVNSKRLQEVTLNYAMLCKSSQLFWPRFFQYVALHPNEEIPIHYREAAFLYATLEQPPFANQLTLDRENLQRRYAAFFNAVQTHMRYGMNDQQAGEAVKEQHGRTFWWYYFFGMSPIPSF